MEAAKEALKYTTVGSIVNHKSSPLQPPTRRGRNIKWPPQLGFEFFSSGFNGLPLGPELRSSTSGLSQPLHYSPLQQNTDRAVSPTMDPPVISGVDMPAASVLLATARTHGKLVETSMTNYADHGDNEDEESSDDETLKQMSVKTLTNLASYDNPKQKMAQKILSAARPIPFQPTQSHPEHISAANFLQSEVGANQAIKSVTYNSFISNSFGAPQPLTAGPPGLRQYKSVPVESTRQSEALVDESSIRPRDLNQIIPLGAHHLVTRQHPASEAHPVASFQEAVRKDNHSSSRIIDTLPAEKACQYYQKGLLPANYNWQNQQLMTGGECGRHGVWADQAGVGFDNYGGTIISNLQKLTKRMEKAASNWNEGNQMFKKTIEEAITEQNYRGFAKIMGREGFYEESKSNVINSHMSVQEANHISNRDHAQPLLSMAFQTLINHEAFTLSGRLPKLEYYE